MIRTIALVAHDSRKAELVNWVKYNAGVLKDCRLICTGTTGRLIGQALKEVLDDEAPEVVCKLSGPLGGDFQIEVNGDLFSVTLRFPLEEEDFPEASEPAHA